MSNLTITYLICIIYLCLIYLLFVQVHLIWCVKINYYYYYIRYKLLSTISILIVKMFVKKSHNYIYNKGI